MKAPHVRLLGPIEAEFESRTLAFASNKAGAVFVVLALSPDRAVSSDRLLDLVWNGEPPSSGLATLHSPVSRLRHDVGKELIELVGHSYRLAVEPEQVDVVRFERLIGEADALMAGAPPEAAARAADALALWRGPPFAGLDGLAFVEAERRRLEGLRLAAVELRVEADVAGGHLTAAIADLEVGVDVEPYRERLWYLLALALARDGRRVEALRTCHRLRRVLAETGLEPTDEMCELESMIATEAPQVHSTLVRHRSFETDIGPPSPRPR